MNASRVFAVIGSVVLLGVVGAADPPKPTGPHLAVTAQLSADRVTVGDEVTLTEAVPRGVKVAVIGFRHELHQIGVYDKADKRIRMRAPKDYAELPMFRLADDPKHFECDEFYQDSVFTKPLDKFWIESGKPISFNQNLVTTGRAIKFKPLIPGAYMITAVWKQKDADPQGTVSNPVILTVLPAK